MELLNQKLTARASKLNELEHLADLWQMKFNPTKCLHLNIANN